MKVSSWDLDGTIQVTSLGRKWAWKRKNCWNQFLWGLSILQKSETRYKSRQNGSWKPAHVTTWDFQKFNSMSWLKTSGWDLDGRSQVTSLRRKWAWKGKIFWNLFYWGLSIHQKLETRYKSRQNGSWKPAQVTKLDFRKINSPPLVKNFRLRSWRKKSSH